MQRAWGNVDIERAVENVLEAALSPDAWPNALRILAETCGADHAFAHYISPESLVSFASRGSEEVYADFQAWPQEVPRMQRALELTLEGTRGLLTDWRCFTPEELARDPFEQEFAFRHQNAHFAGTFIPREDSSFLILSVERGQAKGAYVNEELNGANSLFRLLSLSLNHALKARLDLATGVLGALDQQGMPRAWLDARGRLIAASAAFEKLIGDVLHLRAGRIHAASDDADAKLQWAIAQAAQGAQPLATIALQARADGATLSALPLRGRVHEVLGRADVLLTVSPGGGQPATVETVLRSTYGLTPAEVRLAIRIGRGETLRHAADAEGVSLETARGRLKVILHKTGTSRQLELALMIQRLAFEAERSGDYIAHG